MKKVLSITLALLMAVSCLSVGFEAFAAKNGWYKESFSYYDEEEEKEITYKAFRYYKNGVYLTNWQKIDGKWYWFWDDGENKRNESYWEDGNLYWFNANGVMITGWYHRMETGEYHDEETGEYGTVTYDEWYYFTSGGKAVSGWKKIGGKWYYFDSYGCYMYADGYYEIGKHAYFFKPSGEMVTGWYQYKGTYADEDGEFTYTIWYYADSSGVLVTGWKKISGKWYYFGAYGDMFEDGAYPIDGSIYCFNKSGAMVTGWYNEKGEYFDEIKEKSVKFSEWYYCASSGKALKGWQKIGGVWYYFDKNDAVMKTGWFKDGGKWYYFNSSGAMLASTSKKIGGKTYKFNASGVCTNP